MKLQDITNMDKDDLLLAPKTGSALRQDLRAKLRREDKEEAVGANSSDGVVTSAPA